MATHDDLAVHLPSPRKKKISGEQKKEELEKEISLLHKMLDDEEKVRKILECALDRPDGSTLHIPSFLPPKMKELLAELAMVEDEISRLEGEISHLKHDLSSEEELFKESKSKQWKLEGSLRKPHVQFSDPPNPKPITTTTTTYKGVHERVAFETKALYFISKAIKGDYKLNGFSASNENIENLGGTINQKENYGNEEVEFQEKGSKKSGGVTKPSSPKISQRFSTSKANELGPDISLDFPSKTILNSSPTHESNYKSQPNKLSESIMKCLIFIFVRLLRISRALELEKSGTVSRSTHLSLSSRSFRVETGLNSKMSLSLQRESKQQDPYGIFDVEDSIPRDIGPYKNLVRFTSSSLDLKSISSSSFVPLLRKLRVLLSKLQNVDLRFLTHQQKLAFWINMYNACMMHGFLQYGVPSSQEKLLALMNKATLKIGGNSISALTIEYFILRQPSSSNLKDVKWKSEEFDKVAAVRSIYGLEMLEPNVTFALCCGIRSSPSVRIYTSNGVSSELEKSKLEYLQASIVVTNTKRLLFPELLLRNMLDFAGDMDSLVDWVCHQLPASLSLRKLMVDCFRGHNNGKISTTVEKMPYEFEFQYLLAI